MLSFIYLEVHEFTMRQRSSAFGSVEPSYKPGVHFTDLADPRLGSLPTFVTDAIREALPTAKIVVQTRKGKGNAMICGFEQVTGDITVEDEFEMAIELANKRIVRMANLEYAVRQRRLNSYLARKGYSSSIVMAAVKQAELNLGNSN